MNSSLIILIVIVIIAVVALGIIASIAKMYRKVVQGEALVRTGMGGTSVTFDGKMVVPVIHLAEIMDISIKKVEIARLGVDGLICKDNIRADIKVAFFVRVNKSVDAVKNVAQTIGCSRASSIETLNELFEAKFSEALKTVGKRFNFIDLYDSREEFKKEIINIIGTDLNGYVLDDAAIDYLEQTPVKFLKIDNILDAEGIKRITELTAQENIQSNLIKRDEEKIIKKQDVDAREAILELERQLAEKEEKQRREIANIEAREEAEIQKIQSEEKLKSDMARIAAEEESMIAEENKLRQVIVAKKNKERTEAIETERVEKDRLLEQTERERIVTLAEIEKEKVLEIERRNIQEVIKERVMVEKDVVIEEEKIKDSREFAQAERQKQVAILDAEMKSESALILKVKEAEAQKESAKLDAEKKIIQADADMEASTKESEARKILAEATAKEEAIIGLSEAQVMTAKAKAVETQGFAEATVIEKTAEAEAKGIEAIAIANKQKGIVEAEVMKEKGAAEASAIEEKAEAMKKLDGVGREHEEFKLNLEKEKDIELAQINIDKDIAESQALVIGEALKSANIDIVGGESMFFENIVNQVSRGKGIDRLVESSDNLTALKNGLLAGDGNMMDKIRNVVKSSGVDSETVKNLTLSALLFKIYNEADGGKKGIVQKLMDMVNAVGIGDQNAEKFNL